MSISQIESDLIKEWTEELGEFDSIDWTELSMNVEEFVGRNVDYDEPQLNALVKKVKREHPREFDFLVNDTTPEAKAYLERIAAEVEREDSVIDTPFRKV